MLPSCSSFSVPPACPLLHALEVQVMRWSHLPSGAVLSYPMRTHCCCCCCCPWVSALSACNCCRRLRPAAYACSHCSVAEMDGAWRQWLPPSILDDSSARSPQPPPPLLPPSTPAHTARTPPVAAAAIAGAQSRHPGAAAAAAVGAHGVAQHSTTGEMGPPHHLDLKSMKEGASGGTENEEQEGSKANTCCVWL